MKTGLWAYCGLSALASYGYIGWTSYLFATGAIPHTASFLAVYGIVVGILAIVGIALAKFTFDSARSVEGRPFSSYVLVVLLPVMVGLFSYMKQTGEFDERVLGPFVSYFNTGFGFGLAAGVGMLLLLWSETPRKR